MTIIQADSDSRRGLTRVLGRMSNDALIARMKSTLSSVRSRESAPQVLADVIRSNGRALERMPYALTRETESLAMDLDIASWHDEAGFLPDLGSILSRVESWLDKIPRDAGS